MCVCVCETVCVYDAVGVWVCMHESVGREKEMVITHVCFQQKSSAYIASSSHTLFPNGP